MAEVSNGRTTNARISAVTNCEKVGFGHLPRKNDAMHWSFGIMRSITHEPALAKKLTVRVHVIRPTRQMSRRPLTANFKKRRMTRNIVNKGQSFFQKVCMGSFMTGENDGWPFCRLFLKRLFFLKKKPGQMSQGVAVFKISDIIAYFYNFSRYNL